MSSHTTDAKTATEDAMTQIARLREQVEALVRQKVAPFVKSSSDKMEEVAREAADVARDRADAFADVVRERPLTSVLIATAIGYLIGRVAR